MRNSDVLMRISHFLIISWEKGMIRLYTFRAIIPSWVQNTINSYSFCTSANPMIWVRHPCLLASFKIQLTSDMPSCLGISNLGGFFCNLRASRRKLVKNVTSMQEGGETKNMWLKSFGSYQFRKFYLWWWYKVWSTYTQNIFGLVVTIEHLKGEIFALSHASINSFPHTLKYTYIGVEMQKNIMVKGHEFRKLWAYNRLCILFLR